MGREGHSCCAEPLRCADRCAVLNRLVLQNTVVCSECNRSEGKEPQRGKQCSSPSLSYQDSRSAAKPRASSNLAYMEVLMIKRILTVLVVAALLVAPLMSRPGRALASVSTGTVTASPT